jgi:hypothetical protein
MFASPLGTWIPFNLIFTATYLTGMDLLAPPVASRPIRTCVQYIRVFGHCEMQQDRPAGHMRSRRSVSPRLPVNLRPKTHPVDASRQQAGERQP